MQCSAVNLKPHCQLASSNWTRDVILSEKALAEVNAISQRHELTSEVAQALLSCHFIAMLTCFAHSEWFARNADHWFTGFKFGAPDDTPEGLCEYEYGFVMRRDGRGEAMKITIVSESEGYLTPEYYVEHAIEIARMIESEME